MHSQREKPPNTFGLLVDYLILVLIVLTRDNTKRGQATTKMRAQKVELKRDDELETVNKLLVAVSYRDFCYLSDFSNLSLSLSLSGQD